MISRHGFFMFQFWEYNRCLSFGDDTEMCGQGLCCSHILSSFPTLPGLVVGRRFGVLLGLGNFSGANS